MKKTLCIYFVVLAVLVISVSALMPRSTVVAERGGVPIENVDSQIAGVTDGSEAYAVFKFKALALKSLS